MAKVNIYVRDDLYDQMKRYGLRPSKIACRAFVSAISELESANELGPYIPPPRFASRRNATPRKALHQPNQFTAAAWRGATLRYAALRVATLRYAALRVATHQPII